MTPLRPGDRSQPRPPLRWGGWLAVVVIVVAGVTTSVWASGTDSELHEVQALEAFEDAADRVAGDIVADLDVFIAVARGAAALVIGSVTVEPDEFAAGMSVVLSEDDRSALLASSFLPLIEPDDLEAMVSVRRLSEPGFDVHPPRPGAEFHVPVWLTYPADENAAAVGYDVMASPPAAAAVQRSLDTGEVVMSSSLPLQQDLDGPPAVVVFVPVERQGRLLGWTTAVVPAQRLLESALAREPDLAVRVIELGPDGPVEIAAAPADHRFGEATVSTSRFLTLHGQEWRIDYEALSGWALEAAPHQRWPVMAVGLVITALAALLVLQMERGASRARRLVAERTVELSETNDELRTALESKDDLLAVVSHEFRTPLTVIEGSADMLTDATITDELHGSLVGRIRANSRRLANLVSDLLVAAQVQNGKLEVHPEPVAVARLVATVVSDLGPVGEEVVAGIDPDIVAFVDRHHLALMVTNLVTNAGKYGRPPIDIDAGVVDGRVRLEVRDHGDGIPIEAIPRLFQRFEQGDGSRTRRVSGVGLGLAIVDSLARLNGGAIVYRGDSAGARFVIDLPAHAADRSDRDDLAAGRR